MNSNRFLTGFSSFSKYDFSCVFKTIFNFSYIFSRNDRRVYKIRHISSNQTVSNLQMKRYSIRWWVVVGSLHCFPSFRNFFSVQNKEEYVKRIVCNNAMQQQKTLWQLRYCQREIQYNKVTFNLYSSVVFYGNLLCQTAAI